MRDSWELALTALLFCALAFCVITLPYEFGKTKERARWCAAFHGVLIDGHCVAGNQVLDPERIGK